MRNLIVNADDLGWTGGVNLGIAEAHGNGIVTSSSLLANGEAFASAVELALGRKSLGVGVHLNLSNGEPTAPPELVTSLLNDQGTFAGGPESILMPFSFTGTSRRRKLGSPPASALLLGDATAPYPWV